MTEERARHSFWTDVWSFGREILIVVIGVAMGLWAQQLASDAGWRQTLVTTRETLNDELDLAMMYAWRKRLSEPCVRRFADAAEQFVLHPEATEGRRMPKIAGVQVAIWSDAAWRSAMASQATSHMSAEELAKYSNAYDFLQGMMSLQEKLSDTLPQLRTIGDGRRVTDPEVLEQRLVALGRFRALFQREVNRNKQLLGTLQGELGLKPDPPDMEVARKSAAQCQAQAEAALGPIARPESAAPAAK